VNLAIISENRFCSLVQRMYSTWAFPDSTILNRDENPNYDLSSNFDAWLEQK
jgi:hypothetical protein